MTRRLRAWAWQMAVSLDQTIGTWLFGWGYVWLGGDRHCPDADETISSIVGRAALDGKPWALRWERRIDRLAMWLGGAPGHCRRSIEWDERKN